MTALQTAALFALTLGPAAATVALTLAWDRLRRARGWR